MTELNEKQMEIIYEYCDNNMKKLKMICYPIIIKMGGISEKDYDDIFSLAQLLLYKAVEKYDENNAKGASFNTFFYNILSRRLYATYIRDKNRKCRSNMIEDENGNIVFIPDFSLDAPTEECLSMFERISSSYSLEEEVFKEEYSKEMKEYLSRLSRIQRIILTYLSEGYLPKEVQEMLHINETTYKDNYKAIMDEKNLRIIRTLLGGR